MLGYSLELISVIDSSQFLNLVLNLLLLDVDSGSSLNLTLMRNLIDQVEYKEAFVCLLLVNGAQNITNTRELHFLNLFRWQSTKHF